MGVLECLSVVVIGLGTVFVGLISLVGICKLIGLVCSKLPDGEKPRALPKNDEIPNRQEFIAAVSAALAEELGEDVTAIRITSVRRI
ncbi:MAG: OadG family protein [Clostridia bacterium]|nr:OadG family protein [Clostridia bacterium]